MRFLTVGQTARILGISPSTLRLWENVGLVTPARSAGSYRLYTPELLDILKRIKYLRDVKKLNVPAIQEALRADLTNKQPKPPGKATPELGNKLRRLRKRRGLTVTEAARRAQISAGFLSAVELSRANPSVATIYRLAAAYGSTVLELYDLPAHTNRVIRPRNRKSLQTKSGVRMELLSTGTKMLESMLIRVPPGTGSDGTYMHQGEDFLYMLEGSLEVWLDEVECRVLEQGDSFWFESNRGHRWFNPTNKDAAVLWVNTPPTF
ncbi:MAG TPA: MerR family transcriptional regulator [Terriglobales bacterium]|nr:MerR family transcriptional regulator [Terriglobales bacterium]